MFNVQAFTVTVQFYWMQFSASVFPDSLSFPITWFLLLYHLFYTSTCLVIYILYHPLSTFTIFHHTMQYHLSIFTRSIYINKSNDFITQTFSTNIQYTASFHIAFHTTDFISISYSTSLWCQLFLYIYLLTCFILYSHNVHHYLKGLLRHQPATYTTIFQYI